MPMALWTSKNLLVAACNCVGPRRVCKLPRWVPWNGSICRHPLQRILEKSPWVFLRQLVCLQRCKCFWIYGGSLGTFWTICLCIKVSEKSHWHLLMKNWTLFKDGLDDPILLASVFPWYCRWLDLSPFPQVNGLTVEPAIPGIFRFLPHEMPLEAGGLAWMTV